MKFGNCPKCGNPLKRSGLTDSENYEKCVVCKKNYCNKCIKAWLCPEHFNQLTLEDQKHYLKLSESIYFLRNNGLNLSCIFGMLLIVISFVIFQNYSLIILLSFIMFIILYGLIFGAFLEPLYKRKVKRKVLSNYLSNKNQ